MINPSMLKWLRVIALSDAQDQNFEAWYRSVCRWYSREFNTPLPYVEDMAEAKVLGTYYEDLFWKLRSGTDDQRRQFDELVYQTLQQEHPEFKALADQMAEEDDDWYEKEIAAYDAKIKKKNSKNIKKNKGSDDKPSPVLNPNLKDTMLDTKFVTVNEPIPDDDM